MRDIDCSFRKSRLLPFLLLSVLSLTQCRAEDLWGLPIAQVLERLARGDASFLREASGEALAQDFRLRPGSPYSLK